MYTLYSVERARDAVVLQKKWKNIRDHYRKECARRKTEKSGSGASSAKKEYIYYSQLSFLSSTVETRPQKSSDKVEEDTDVQTARSECSQDLPKIQAKKKKVSHEDSLIGALSANIYKQIQEPKEDADKDFLMSLLPYVKSVPDSAKLECRCEIMQVLKKYNTSSINPMQYAPYPNSHVNYQNYQTPIQNSQPVLGHCSYEMQNRQTPGASLPAFSPLSTQSVASSDTIIEELIQ
ncbi:uncharacterized protein LOC143024744 isoform X2 [Oratosquilla oratoria]|uniref:uncharacterized protein LOC143024744 isoform X2 n=1 Tax=Oratosquilla oratoria TaxID=337810 RepID=UPI003F768342